MRTADYSTCGEKQRTVVLYGNAIRQRDIDTSTLLYSTDRFILSINPGADRGGARQSEAEIRAGVHLPRLTSV